MVEMEKESIDLLHFINTSQLLAYQKRIFQTPTREVGQPWLNARERRPSELLRGESHRTDQSPP